jgi:hypothetical protein
VAKATKNKKGKKTKRRREGGPDVPNASKTEIKHKEGRHVGLDFYDLLIEAIGAAAEATKPPELSMSGVAWRLGESASRLYRN